MWSIFIKKSNKITDANKQKKIKHPPYSKKSFPHLNDFIKKIQFIIEMIFNI